MNSPLLLLLALLLPLLPADDPVEPPPPKKNPLLLLLLLLSLLLLPAPMTLTISSVSGSLQRGSPLSSFLRPCSYSYNCPMKLRFGLMMDRRALTNL